MTDIICTTAANKILYKKKQIWYLKICIFRASIKNFVLMFCQHNVQKKTKRDIKECNETNIFRNNLNHHCSSHISFFFICTHSSDCCYSFTFVMRNILSTFVHIVHTTTSLGRDKWLALLDSEFGPWAGFNGRLSRFVAAM